jgi:four helix bundle protein
MSSSHDSERLPASHGPRPGAVRDDLTSELRDLNSEISDLKSEIQNPQDPPVKYERFEDLPVWNSAIDLADRVYHLTRDRSFSQPGNLLDQLRRAALSVSNNIAEGFERGTTAELLMFLYIARGSAGEVRSMLLFADRRPELSHLKSEISNLKSLAESCSRQLRAWADNLQNSDIRGQRHLNADSRKDFELKRNSDELKRNADALWTRLEAEQSRRVAEWSQTTNAPSDPPPKP